MATLDLREVTAEQAVDMLITIAGLRTEACQLRTGDKVVYYDERADTYVTTTIESSTGSYYPGRRPSANEWRIRTASGDSWTCSPHNVRCVRVAS
jgi:hypothetical protein